MITREVYIHSVRDVALSLADISADQRAHLTAIKLVYGTGYKSGARGVTYYDAWAAGNASAAPLIEICAFNEESLVQLAGTTIHELGHALAGKGKGHGKEWREACYHLGLRRMKAAGTHYIAALFAPKLREAIASLPVPSDGRAVNWSDTGPVAVKVRGCSAGHGSRGGKTGGPGSGSRLRKWHCAPCGVIARVASDDFRALCGHCGGPFSRG